MIQIKRLQHIGVYMADPDKAAAWYETAMGFKVIGRFETAAGHRAVFVRSEAVGVTYELVGMPAGSPELAHFRTNPADVDHIAYEVDDLDAAFAEAKRLGLEITDGLGEIPTFWERGFRCFKLRAATGESVEICKVL